MRHPKEFPCHECAPKEWRRTPNITGSYELDAVIRKNPNKDMVKRLDQFVSTEKNIYGPKTAYNGYESGDS